MFAVGFNSVISHHTLTTVRLGTTRSLPPPPKVMGGYVFACVSMSVDIYDCDQLLGANSSPVVTKLCQSYPWPQWTR